MVSATVSDGKSRASWNERPRPTDGPPVRRPPAVMSRRPADRARRSGARKPEMTSKIVVLPAPLWPMRPTIRPGGEVEVDVVDGEDPAEALGQPGDLRPSAGSVRRTCRRARWPGVPRAPRPPAPADEDRAQDVGPLEQVRRRALEAHCALLQEDGATGELEGHVHGLLDHHDRGPALRGSRRTLSHSMPDDRGREAERQLVDEEQLRASATNAMASDSCCCSPPERLPAI